MLWRVLRRTFRAQVTSTVGPHGLLDANGDPSRGWGCDFPAAVNGFSKGTQGLLYIPYELIYVPYFFFLETFSLTFHLKCYSLKTSLDASNFYYPRKP